MAVLTAMETAYVVRNRTSGVVAMFWGADAPEEAQDWAARGYEVEKVDRALVA